MTQHLLGRRTIVTAGPLLLAQILGCRVFARGPSEGEMAAAIKSAPPAPNTVGPTYLAQVESIQVEERGPYNTENAYWPVRVRVKGLAKVKLTNLFQLGLLGDRAKEKAEPVDFVEEARFTKDDYGHWRVSYHYSAESPKWRLNELEMLALPK